MSPTIRELLAQPYLGLTVLAGEDRLDQRIRWVATSELADPTPYLQGGELVLTTGMHLPHAAAAVRGYVDRLAGAGAVALGLGVEVVHDRTPARLVNAAKAAGIVLLEVDGPTPFVAISKAVSDLLLREQHAELLRASEAQQKLTRAAVREGPSGVVRAAARLIGGWALLLDRDGAVRVAHPGAARRHRVALQPELARLRDAGPAASSLVEGEAHISVQPVLADRRAYGFFAVGVPRAPTAVERTVIGVATALLSVAQPRSGTAERRRAAAVLRLARSGQAQNPQLLADLAGPLFGRSTLHVVAVTGDRSEIDAWLGQLEPEGSLAAGEDGAALAVLADAGRRDATLELVRRSASLRAGVSEPTAPRGLAAGIAQAERARSLAVSRDVPVVTHAEAMAGVVGVADPSDAAAFAERLLRPLREHQQRTGVDLVETLRVWLRRHGHFDPAATDLGLHRHTLRHRVRRAETLLGRSLDDPDARMDLWFALKVDQP